MTSQSADGLLVELSRLALSKDAAALVKTGELVSAYLAGLSGDPSHKAEALAGLQARLQRQTAPSPTRSEILDVMSDHVVRLLEAN